jgi:hypothetical protein
MPVAGNPDMTQHEASHPRPNVSARLNSLDPDVTFNVHEKLLEYDLASKVRSDSLSREEVGGLIEESENESREYDREIGKLEAEIKRREAEIGRLKSVIVALRNRQEKLDTLTKVFRTALRPCPIRKLPAELLSEIFRLALDERPNKVSFHRFECSSRVPLLSLARTCAHWRSIAFDTPSLWARIDITLSPGVPDDDDPEMIVCERAVAFVLERSRNHPLSLLIDVNLDRSPLPRAMERLIRESCRWHSLDIWVCCSSSVFNFLGLAPSLDLSNLCSFALQAVWDRKEPEIPSCLVAFQNAPMLRTVDLGTITMPDDRIWAFLPWHQLETITCSCSPCYCPAKLISSCTSLKSARIFYNPGLEQESSPIHEPLTTSMNTLELLLNTPKRNSEFSLHMAWCLKQLQLNSLRSLAITSDCGHIVLLQPESFIKLVSEYKSLTSLRLWNVAFYGDSWSVEEKALWNYSRILPH